MTEHQQTLTAMQVREAGVDDWRQILGRVKARFRTGDFATGLALVNKIGEAAEAADHHPDITLTYTDVIVALTSRNEHGITSRDLDLAQQISGRATELGIKADVSGPSLSWNSDSTPAWGNIWHRSTPPCSAQTLFEVNPPTPAGRCRPYGGKTRTKPTRLWHFLSSSSSSAGISTCGCLTTRQSIDFRLCLTPADA